MPSFLSNSFGTASLDQFAYMPPDIIGCEAEVWKQVCGLAGGTEAVDAEYSPMRPDIFPPAQSRSGLYRQTSRDGLRQDAFTVSRVLSVEDLGGRHGNQPDAQTR